eukprot:GHVP01013940.1.p1 GENE.GHVP01013940.1~~GHVP01013940.1.p1  ORF type:complete len:125 (+),score=14.13 GHVP01013940.1:194-568(+)
MSAREQKQSKKEGVDWQNDKHYTAGASFFSEFRRKIKELEAVNTQNMRPSSSQLPLYPRVDKSNDSRRTESQIGSLLKKESKSNFSKATTSSIYRTEDKVSRPIISRFLLSYFPNLRPSHFIKI